MWNIVDKIFKLATLFSLLLIVFGNFYINSFYKVFSINIYEYVSPTETLSLFLPDLIKLVIFIILIGFPLWMFFFDILTISNLRNLFSSSSPIERSESKLFRSIKRIFFSIIAVICIYGVQVIGYRYNPERSPTDNNNSFFIVALIQLITPNFILLILSKKLIKAELKSFLFLLSLLIFNNVIFLDKLAKFIAIKEKYDTQTVHYKFTTDKIDYMTSDSLKYIGSTNSTIFLFLHNGSNEKIIAISKSTLIKPVEIEYEIDGLYPK